MTCRVELPGGWIDSGALEQALLQCPDLHASGEPDVDVVFLHGAKVMIGAAVRLLSLFNQLDNATKRVRLRFQEGKAGAMGYLNRMGFFDHLSGRVEVFPERPTDSGAETYGGTNPGLVEIARIDRQRRDRGLPTSLAETLKRACSQRPDVDSLGGAAWTIFAELIDNVFSHSQTPLDGYAALQVYRKGSSVKAAVSDSGLGIMKTLRPALQQSAPRLAALSDEALLVEIFRQGVSRHGKDRGCGLKGCAEKAMKFKAELDIRLPNSRVLLVPGRKGYRPNMAYTSVSLPLLWGTHICFTFPLTVD